VVTIKTYNGGSGGMVSGSADLSNFTALINPAADSNLSAHVLNASGFDIVFDNSTSCSGSGSALLWDLVSYSAGTAEIHVKIGTLTHGSDVLVSMYYGNSGVSTYQSTRASAWDSNYVIVSHLDEASNAQAIDVKSGYNSTTNLSTQVTGAFGAGTLGKGQSFNGTNQNVIYSTAVPSTSSYTTSIWFSGSSANTNVLVDQRNVGMLMYTVAGTNYLRSIMLVVTVDSSSPAIADGTWHYAVATYTNIDGMCRLYVDGTQAASQSGCGTFTVFSPARLGQSFDPAFHPATVDEFRHSTEIARSADWIMTEYRNQHAPGTYVTFGSEQTNNISPSFSATATAVTANSVLLTWTTGTKQSSQGSCGTVSGGPYSYATPVVDAVKAGDTYYGVTSHSIAVVVPNPSTTYYCFASSVDTSGTTTISYETTGVATPAALTSVPFTVASYGNPIYYDDQGTGKNGMPSNGRSYNSDTLFGTMADDGNWYVNGNDYVGALSCCFNSVGVGKLSADGLTATQLGNTTGSNNTGGTTSGGNNHPTTYTADGGRSYAEGLVSVRGKMYQYLPRAGGSAACTVVEKTADHWSTTIGPQSNTGPSVSGSTFTGAGQGNYDYPTTAVGCSTTLALAWQAANFCQDWGGTAGTQFTCPHNVGTDGWVYGSALTPSVGNIGNWIVRVRVEDIAITEASQFAGRYQVYTGSGSGSDGLLDSNWTTYDASIGTVLNLGRRTKIFWLGSPFNRWGAISYANPNSTSLDQGGSILIYDLGRYPWSWNDAVVVYTIPKDPVTHPLYYPVFPDLIRPSYVDLGNGTARVRMSTTGSYVQQDYTNPDVDRYSPTYRDLIFAPRTSAVARQYFGNGRGQHAIVPDLLYAFTSASMSTVLSNAASIPGTYNTTGLANMSYSGQGMNGFGFPMAASYGSQQTVTITTGYNATLATDFTLLLTFEHDSNGTIPSAETPLDKAGKITISRNSTTANSWKVKIGSTTSSAFSLTTDGSFATMILRRSGSTTTIYSSAGIAANGTFTALGTVSDSSSLTGAITLGSLAGGTQPFYGTLGELAVFPRALSDVELIGEVAAARADMAARIPSVVIP
jgi:hypothetical protein